MNINKGRKIMRRAAALLALLCMAALAAQAEGTPAVFTKATRVYQKASTSSASIKVKKELEVNVLATNGGWARVERDGTVAYARLSELKPIGEDQGEYDALMKNAQPAVITSATRVYQKANASSASLKVKKGTQVNLLATRNGWAMVENDGVIAYIPIKYVTLASEYEAEPSYEEMMKDAQPAVITRDTRVYQKASTSSASMKAKKGTQVNLLATNGDWARVENGGVIAYMNRAHVSTLEQAVVPTPEPTATPKPDYSGYLANAQDAYINQDTKVYESADVSSAYTTASKGLEVQLLAVKNGWALIERSGAYGFTNADHVSIAVKATPAPTPAADTDYLTSSKYTNEQKCYLFLTKEAGLNAAAAHGILANIRCESNYNPSAGSSYYGLCQWGGGRLTNLKKFCAANGYAVSSLEGQLRFLMHELKNSYPSVLKYLQSVDNTASGAYDAAYHFCYNFERPANKATVSATRATLALTSFRAN